MEALGVIYEDLHITSAGKFDNMTQRVISESTYNLTYDAENRLTGVSGAATALSFTMGIATG